ncbi:MAG: hypothetical protein IT258_01855 [Saprospiraceae bacterium]|nr:hypothetical protein [Saprospiraceae bacterium]
MKKLAITFAALLFVSVAQVLAQNSNCENGYLAFKSGMSMELTHYDKKGKTSGTSRHKVLDVGNIPDGFAATIEMENTDGKGKRSTASKFDIKCKGNSMFIDMRSLMNPEAMANTQDMEMEMTGDAMEFPNELTPGQTLPNGQMELKMMMNGMKFMTIKLNISNRKVEGTETVTTPAGSFECVKMTQDTEMQSIFKMKTRTATWYAKGVGMVKTENYDKNGKVESSTVLTKLEK